MPELPAATLSKKGPGQLPTGETTPIPVTTTRCNSVMLKFCGDLIEYVTHGDRRCTGLIEANVKAILDLEHEFYRGQRVEPDLFQRRIACNALAGNRKLLRQHVIQAVFGVVHSCFPVVISWAGIAGAKDCNVLPLDWKKSTVSEAT